MQLVGITFGTISNIRPSHLFSGCDLQFGECFVCSGNINDWLLVKLAELWLDRNRCSAFFIESAFFSDTSSNGDEAAAAAAPVESLLWAADDDCGTVCGWKGRGVSESH